MGYSSRFQCNIYPLTEVTVSVGATEAIFAITQALIEPGDEVVVFEPAFDIYAAQVFSVCMHYYEFLKVFLLQKIE